MYSEDKDNYGTPFSYATKSEDNEVKRISRMMSGWSHMLTLQLTITDYNGFVLSIAGEKVEGVEYFYRNEFVFN